MNTNPPIAPAHIPVDEFPILQQGHYANHTAIVPWPRTTSRAVADFSFENSERGKASQEACVGERVFANGFE